MAGSGVADILGAIDADPRECARRLERALAGMDLAAVIADLAALGGGPAAGGDATAEAARSWLGADADAVLDGGLERLPAGKLRELLRVPARLAGLQELVLTQGGPHWADRVRGDAAISALAERHRRTIAAGLGLSDRPRRAGDRPAGNAASRGKDRPPQGPGPRAPLG